MSDMIELEVGGLRHSGWKNANVQTGFDRFAGSFSLTLADKWPDDSGFDLEQLSVEAGQSCAIYVGGELIISGFIDQALPQINGESHEISINGRSKAADLLDSSAVHSPATWSQRRLEDIAADLIAPFGLKITAQTSTGEAFKKFALQQGESVFQAIERMCQMRGLLPISAANGDIIIMTPQISGAIPLLEGENILSASAQHDVSGRYSEYIVKGQSASDDDHNGRATSQLVGSAKDPAIGRYRPLIIIGEEQGNSSTYQLRAEWEAKVRAAQSQSATVIVPDWRTRGGALWREGMGVDLFAPSLFITDTMIISAVDFSIDEYVQTTALSLAYPDAYAQLPQDDAQASQIERARP